MGNSLQFWKNPEKNQFDQEHNSSSNFTCEICIEPTSENQKFKNKNLCAHPFCLDCMSKYIETKVQDNNIGNIECPGLECRRLLDPLSCRSILSPELFTKWCDLLCELSILELDIAYCPNRSCGELVVNECGGNVKKSKCPNCLGFFCFQCKVPWHAGYRCDEATELRDVHDILFGKLVEQKKWVRCPGCGHCVERFEGCLSVKCRCSTRFCYKCGRKLSKYLRACGCKNLQGAGELSNWFVYVVLCVFMVVAFVVLYVLYPQIPKNKQL